MKRSNKLTVGYVIISLLLFLSLAAGGVYGVYASVGLSFVRSGAVDVPTEMNGIANVSYGGSVNFSPNMTGVIVLSVLLILLSVLDLIAMIKQIVFFKQFKFVRESKIENKIEDKIKSKGGVVFFVVLIDILSIVAGFAGLLLNGEIVSGNRLSWIFYAIDISVSVLALLSLILLCLKLRRVKKIKEQVKSFQKESENHVACSDEFKLNLFDIDDLEYMLLKLRYLKSSRLISGDEYNDLRLKLMHKEVDSEVDDAEKINKKRD